jgi:hypothetical protein
MVFDFVDTQNVCKMLEVLYQVSQQNKENKTSLFLYM